MLHIVKVKKQKHRIEGMEFKRTSHISKIMFANQKFLPLDCYWACREERKESWVP